MLRRINIEDLPRVLAIERVTQLSPWSEETFLRCLSANHIGWVIELNKTVEGFIILSYFQEDCHILNINIAPTFQHQGFGTQLLTCALENMEQTGVRMAYLEVRRSNLFAIQFYDKCGFVEISQRKHYYPGPSGREDALVFAKELNSL